MNVASLNICKELYELSGWTWTEKCWETRTNQGWNINLRPYADSSQNDGLSRYYPAYDLGYLLRKLPVVTEVHKYSDHFHARYVNVKRLIDEPIEINSGTPEDATAKLAIELFKQGILTKENK